MLVIFLGQSMVEILGFIPHGGELGSTEVPAVLAGAVSYAAEGGALNVIVFRDAKRPVARNEDFAGTPPPRRAYL